MNRKIVYHRVTIVGKTALCFIKFTIYSRILFLNNSCYKFDPIFIPGLKPRTKKCWRGNIVYGRGKCVCGRGKCVWNVYVEGKILYVEGVILYEEGVILYEEGVLLYVEGVVFYVRGIKSSYKYQLQV